MNNNLTTINQSSKLVLTKSKKLLNVTNKILANKKKNEQIAYSWIDKLWKWADDNNVPDLRAGYNNILEGIPRIESDLLSINTLNLSGFELTTIPKELFNLTNIRFLNLSKNKLISIPNEIQNLENLENLTAKIGLNRTTMQELDRTQKRSLTGQ